MKVLFASILLTAGLAIPAMASAQQFPLPPGGGTTPPGGGTVQPVGPQICDSQGCFQRYCFGTVCVNVQVSGPLFPRGNEQQ